MLRVLVCTRSGRPSLAHFSLAHLPTLALTRAARPLTKRSFVRFVQELQPKPACLPAGRRGGPNFPVESGTGRTSARTAAQATSLAEPVS